MASRDPTPPLADPGLDSLFELSPPPSGPGTRTCHVPSLPGTAR